MTTQKVPSFMDAALTGATTKTSSNATLAKMVEARSEDNFANRIGGAWADLVEHRNQLRVYDLADNSSLVRDMPIKPEQFLSFCQYMMNQCCWAARRYVQAAQSAADQEAIRGITGIDFSQDVAADLGVEPLSTAELNEALEADFEIMARLYSVLSCKMNYLPMIDELCMYADRQQEGENWNIVASANNFDDALVIMSDVIVNMREREEGALKEEMATTDFSSDPVTAKGIPTEEARETAAA